MRTMVGTGGCTGVIAANTNVFGRGADWLSKQGARALAKMLEAYWHRNGYPAARFWAEPIDEIGEGLITAHKTLEEEERSQPE